MLSYPDAIVNMSAHSAIIVDAIELIVSGLSCAIFATRGHRVAHHGRCTVERARFVRGEEADVLSSAIVMTCEATGNRLGGGLAKATIPSAPARVNHERLGCRAVATAARRRVPHCRGVRRLLAAIHDPMSIERVLVAMGLPRAAPEMAPARSPPTQAELLW